MAKHAAFERLPGKFPLKAPRQTARFGNEGFMSGVIVGEKHKKMVAESFGLEVKDTFGLESGVWYSFKGYVLSHVDGCSPVLAYLAKGNGVLGLMNGSRLQEEEITAGEVFLFDDRKRHFWACNTPCQMFVMNVKKPANHTASGLKPSR